MVFNTSPESEQGEFNQAFAYLIRLDEILRELDVATYNRDYDKQFKACHALYKEMRPMSSTAQKTKASRDDSDDEAQELNEREALDGKFSELRDLYRNTYAKNFNKGRVSHEFIDKLDEFEMILRDLIQSKGMLMPKKQDPRFAMSN